MKLPLVVSGTVLDCEAPHGASRLVLVWIKGASFYRGTRLQTPRLRTTSHQALSNNTDLAPRPPTSAFSPSLWKPLVLQAPCQSSEVGIRRTLQHYPPTWTTSSWSSGGLCHDLSHWPLTSSPSQPWQCRMPSLPSCI